MKPRIHLDRLPGVKVWICYAGDLWDRRTAIGFGASPTESFDDWQSLPKHRDCEWMKANAQ